MRARIVSILSKVLPNGNSSIHESPCSICPIDSPKIVARGHVLIIRIYYGQLFFSLACQNFHIGLFPFCTALPGFSRLEIVEIDKVLEGLVSSPLLAAFEGSVTAGMPEVPGDSGVENTSTSGGAQSSLRNVNRASRRNVFEGGLVSSSSSARSSVPFPNRSDSNPIAFASPSNKPSMPSPCNIAPGVCAYISGCACLRSGVAGKDGSESVTSDSSRRVICDVSNDGGVPDSLVIGRHCVRPPVVGEKSC